MKNYYILLWTKFRDTKLSGHCTKVGSQSVRHEDFQKINYMYDRTNNKNMKWIDDDLKVPGIQQSQLLSSIPKRLEQNSQGRPNKFVEESSQRSKQRKINSIVSDHSSEHVCLAAESSLVKLVIESTLTRQKKKIKMKLVYDISSSSTIIPYSTEEALGLIVDLRLTKKSYVTIRL